MREMYGHRIALTGPHWNREWKSFNHLPLISRESVSWLEYDKSLRASKEGKSGSMPCASNNLELTTVLSENWRSDFL
jgi:hypothetical protein